MLLSKVTFSNKYQIYNSENMDKIKKAAISSFYEPEPFLKLIDFKISWSFSNNNPPINQTGAKSNLITPQIESELPA